MTITTYEVARNAYAQTGGKWHVRGVSDTGLTQSESTCPTFRIRRDAETAADDLNTSMAACKAGHAAWIAELTAEHAARPELF